MRPGSRTVFCLGAALALTAVTGCGSDDQPAVCASVSDLKSSVDHVKDVNVSENGLPELRSSLTRVREDARRVAADAGQQYAPQIDAVTASVQALDLSLQAAKDDPSTATLTSLATAARAVASGVDSLQQAVETSC